MKAQPDSPVPASGRKMAVFVSQSLSPLTNRTTPASPSDQTQVLMLTVFFFLDQLTLCFPANSWSADVGPVSRSDINLLI